MRQWYRIESDFKYNGPAKCNELKSWLMDNMDGLYFEYEYFCCWGENHYGLIEEILEQLSAAGNLESAELDAYRGDEGCIRYIWNPRKKNWMAYFFATWKGKIFFKEKPSDDQIKALEKEFCEPDILEPKYDPENRWIVNIYGSGNYSKTSAYEALNKIVPSIISGKIVFSGGGDTHWKIEFVKGNWIEENGVVAYLKDDANSF